MTREFVSTMRGVAMLVGIGAAIAIAIIGSGPWRLMPMGVLLVCGMILSFSSLFTEAKSEASERATSLKTRRRLVILIEAAFWAVVVGLVALIAFGQTRSAAYYILLVVGVLLLGPSLRIRQLYSITSPKELAGEIAFIGLLILGFVFLMSL